MARLWIVLILVITPIVNRAEEDISCHYKSEGDALPSADDPRFSPPTDSIFFHETSCQGELNSRQACAIESAAKAHPAKQIYLLFSGPITSRILYYTRSNLFEMQINYPNINFARVHVDEYAKGTALEEIFTKRTHNSSQWKFVHASDLLRLLTMYKFGGLYLDIDMIVVKPFDGLGRNYVTKDSDWAINNAVVNAAKNILGQEFMRRVLEEVSTSYNPQYWSHNGPAAMQRVLSRFCNTEVQEFSKATCRGIQVYNSELFYPVQYGHFKKLLEPGDLQNVDKAYSIHLWNNISRDFEVQHGSPFDKLAKKHCPIIRALYGDCFGF